MFHRHLEEDEPLYMVVQKHWVFGVQMVFWPTVALTLTWVFLYYAPLRPIAIVVAGIDAALLVWWMRNFLDYYLDGLVITDRAVIDIEWHGWFHRSSTRIDYSSIEGVSYEIQGVLGTLLNFGTITIERIGSGKEVEIRNVKKPKDIESTILVCQEACIRAKNMKDSSAVKDIIAEIVAERMYLKEHDVEEEEVEV